MKLIAAAALAASILATPVLAQDAKIGWAVQFRQDTFDKTVFPLAIMSEDGENYSKAMLFVACAKDGSLIAAFNPAGVVLFDQSAKVQFRGADGTKDFTFSAREIPHMGKFRALDKADSAALLDLVAKGAGEVPFRSGDKQGIFSSIGGAAAFEIMRSSCPK